jgi:hypothetical protein
VHFPAFYNIERALWWKGTMRYIYSSSHATRRTVEAKTNKEEKRRNEVYWLHTHTHKHYLINKIFWNDEFEIIILELMMIMIIMMMMMRFSRSQRIRSIMLSVWNLPENLISFILISMSASTIPSLGFRFSFVFLFYLWEYVFLFSRLTPLALSPSRTNITFISFSKINYLICWQPIRKKKRRELNSHTKPNTRTSIL